MSAPKGWTGKFLEVDLASQSVMMRDTMPYAPLYLGGRGIAARLAWEMTPAGVDAFDPANPLIVFTGPLTGTIAPTSGRTVLVSVSPRVYPRPWVTHSTMGGWIGPELKYAGYDGLVILGRAKAPVYLSIDNDRVQVCDAGELWGLGTRETQIRLKGRHGEKARVMCIGPAGENLVRIAVIQHEEECASGHSGFGAVMGGKNLKAVVVRGSRGVAVARPRELLREIGRVREVARLSPVDAFSRPQDPAKPANRRPVCSQSCPVNCVLGSVHRVEGLPDDVTNCVGHNYTGGAIETSRYESRKLTIPPGHGFGPVDGVRAHLAGSDLGLDLWVLPTLQPWLLKCLEEGVSSIRGVPLRPAEPGWFIDLMQAIAHRRGLGALFSEGLRRAADALEGELPATLIEAARSSEFAFGFPAHREGRLWDPEPMPFWVVSALMYASESRDPTIGSHASCMLLANLKVRHGELAAARLRLLSKELWAAENALDPTYDHVVPVAIWVQHQHIVVDSLPLCDFSFPRTIGGFQDAGEWCACAGNGTDIEIGARLLSACVGDDYRSADLERVAERVLNLERALLAAFGRDRGVDASIQPHFELPCKTDGTCMSRIKFDSLMDSYYKARGWDSERGWPTRDKLEELHLGDVAGRLQACRGGRVR